MKIQIKETGEFENLTILDKNNIDWTADLISAGSLEHDDDGITILSQDDYDWWTKYIEDHDQTDDDIEELAEELEDESIECPNGYGWLTYIEEEIAKNTGNDYEYHRKEAVEVLNEIKDEYLK